MEQSISTRMIELRLAKFIDAFLISRIMTMSELFPSLGVMMVVGDYVGKINNPWVEKNPWLLLHTPSTMAKELFDYQEPEPLGVIVQFSLTKEWVIVLKADGSLFGCPIGQVVVIDDCH